MTLEKGSWDSIIESMAADYDYPYEPIREALGTVIGRICLVLAAVLLGAALAGVSATREISGCLAGWLGFIGFNLASLLLGFGIFVFPLVLIFAIFFVRNEWPLATVLVCTVLMWWNQHKTMRWMLYDSPEAKQRQAINEAMQQALEQRPKEVRRAAVVDQQPQN